MYTYGMYCNMYACVKRAHIYVYVYLSLYITYILYVGRQTERERERERERETDRQTDRQREGDKTWFSKAGGMMEAYGSMRMGKPATGSTALLFTKFHTRHGLRRSTRAQGG